MWMLDTPFMIVAGLLTGVVFGVLLQKAHVTRYEVIVGQFLFKDFTVLKVMLTAIVVGAVGVFRSDVVRRIADDDLDPCD
mgnify:CR=1 FL=1